MQTADDVLRACAFIKSAGTSSRVPVPITVLEKLCRDAIAWNSAPEMMRQAVKEMGEPK